ncbi:hypothetical protein [Nisaea sediminum]|uniref:hypothetical protein n=1 Tax=Nisaea sediminum TaxID=2775867 RepID=UPI00186627FA|nr:hypothetical protein [Nisaea sediminum]
MKSNTPSLTVRALERECLSMLNKVDAQVGDGREAVVDDFHLVGAFMASPVTEAVQRRAIEVHARLSDGYQLISGGAKP